MTGSLTIPATTPGASIHTMTDLLRSLIHQTRLWRAALFVSMAVILWLATAKLDHPIEVSSWDKINHLVAFIEVTLLTRLGWPQMKALHVAVAMLGFGVLIEIVQFPLPYRETSLLDVFADSLGIAAGLILWRFTGARLSTTS
ncbi:VanZ family protein [Marinobacter mangrovi]|uniref:VanZ family protein n=1 Tax=Marinobacter mangrovi TaxID=2803918 RepID=UPI001F2954DF|nr:VanZ family protein [Marinobacter mangrovi]